MPYLPSDTRGTLQEGHTTLRRSGSRNLNPAAEQPSTAGGDDDDDPATADGDDEDDLPFEAASDYHYKDEGDDDDDGLFCSPELRKARDETLEVTTWKCHVNTLSNVDGRELCSFQIAHRANNSIACCFI